MSRRVVALRHGRGCHYGTAAERSLHQDERPVAWPDSKPFSRPAPVDWHLRFPRMTDRPDCQPARTKPAARHACHPLIYCPPAPNPKAKRYPAKLSRPAPAGRRWGYARAHARPHWCRPEREPYARRWTALRTRAANARASAKRYAMAQGPCPVRARRKRAAPSASHRATSRRRLMKAAPSDADRTSRPRVPSDADRTSRQRAPSDDP